MKKTKQIKLFGSIALVLITLLGTFFVVLPVLEETTNLETTREEIMSGNTDLDRRIAELEKDRTNVGKITETYLELVRRFPTSIEATNLLADITNAATLAGMSPANVEGIVFSKPDFIKIGDTVSDSLAVMEVTITVNGTPNQLTSFLGTMNEVNRVIKISNINISTRGTEGISSMTINGTSYIYKGIAIPDRTAAVESNPNQPSQENPVIPTPTIPERPELSEIEELQ